MDRVTESRRLHLAACADGAGGVRAATAIFTVTGIGAHGLAAVGCATAARALSKATDLASHGVTDVLIADGTGAQYTLERFVRVFFMGAATPVAHRHHLWRR